MSIKCIALETVETCRQGTCVDLVGRYECRCPPGFAGPRCEADLNECLSAPCVVAGTRDCVQLVGDYRCVCLEGWTGRHCDTRQSSCEARPCSNGARCVEVANTTLCQCLPVFIYFLLIFFISIYVYFSCFYLVIFLTFNF